MQLLTLQVASTLVFKPWHQYFPVALTTAVSGLPTVLKTKLETIFYDSAGALLGARPAFK